MPVRFGYAGESDPGPYPIPPDAPVEGGPDAGGDRHVLVVQAGSCRLYELFDAHREGGGWRAGSGAVWDLRVQPAATGRLDLGGRRRAADPGRAGPLRGGGQGPDRPCDPGHRRPEPGQLPLAGPPPGRAGRRVAAADGAAAAAQGRGRHRRVPRPGQGDPAGHADLWAGGGRQRVVGVHRRCARRALGQRRPPPARAGHPGRLRGRRHRPAADLPRLGRLPGRPRASPARPAADPPGGARPGPAARGRPPLVPARAPVPAGVRRGHPGREPGPGRGRRRPDRRRPGSPALLPQILAAILGVVAAALAFRQVTLHSRRAATPLPAATLRGSPRPHPHRPGQDQAGPAPPDPHQVPPDPDPAGSRRP